MLRSFTHHPHAVGDTYVSHAVTASGFGGQLILAGLACLVHAVLPWTFEGTASRRVRQIHASMTARHPPAAVVPLAPVADRRDEQCNHQGNRGGFSL